MKAFKKILTVVLLAALALSLTSCLSLDEAKAHHLKYADITRETISFNGKTYKKLPETSYNVAPSFLYSDGEYNLTAPDVPVLVSEMYGSDAYYNGQYDLILVWNGSEDKVESALRLNVLRSDSMEIVSEYFTSEENYEKYAAEFEDPDFTSYSAEKYVYDQDTYELMSHTIEVLPDNVAKMLTDEMKNEENAVSDARTAQSVFDNSPRTVFDSSTADGLLNDPARGIMVFEYGSDHYAAFIEDGEATDTLTRLSEETVKAIEPYLDDSGYDFEYYY